MFIALLFEAVGRYFRYRSQLISVDGLDDHILRDIGLDRGALRLAASDMTTRTAWQ